MSTTTFIIITAIVIVLFLFIKSRNRGMDPNEFRQKLRKDPGVIIDVRTPAEYNSGHLKRTDYNIDITSRSFRQKLEKLDKNKMYYLYCRTGSRSGRAVKIMQSKGFENVYNVGGLQRLLNNGFKKE